MNNETRVYLRAFEPEDYKTTIQWRKDEEIWSLLGGNKIFVSEENERQWVLKTINDNCNIKLAICLKENDVHIGNVYLTDINMVNRTAESHVLIGNHNYWKRGYAKEALIQILEYAFLEKGLNRIVAYILEDNIGSIKMHTNLGYKQEGVLRQSVYKNGHFKNQIVMSILKDEFTQMFV